MIHPPYRTGEGLFLEDAQVLIPWGTPLDQADVPGGPETLQSDHGDLFEWRNRQALGGLRGHLSAFRQMRPLGTTIFPGGLPTLEWFSMDVASCDDGTETAHRSAAAICGRLRDSLRRIYDRLESTLGPATWSYAGYRLGLPSITWERLETTHGLLSYSCAPAADGRIDISVAHWTTDYPELRAEAERAHALWARSDARVPFVAWDVDDPRLPQDMRNWRVALAKTEFTDSEWGLASGTHPEARKLDC